MSNYHSQQDEEPVILTFFGGNVGRFYDIGAYDGKTFSNTYALLERGWSGVMVEPEPMSFMALMRHTEQWAERINYVNAAVSRRHGLAKFWDSRGDAVSSLDEKHVAKWNPKINGGMRPFYVNPVCPEDLFAAFGPAEFINLDVEGGNWDMFQTLPFEWDELRMICVECDDKADAMTELAGGHGFALTHRTAQNLIMTR